MTSLLILSLAAQAGWSGTAFDLGSVKPVAPTAAASRCAPQDDDAGIMVCGARADRYRLPLPDERAPVAIAHDVPGGLAALTPVAPCGIFVGQRRCGKAEAAAFGYGSGRDPLTVVSRVAGRIAHPDAD